MTLVWSELLRYGLAGGVGLFSMGLPAQAGRTVQQRVTIIRKGGMPVQLTRTIQATVQPAQPLKVVATASRAARTRVRPHPRDGGPVIGSQSLGSATVGGTPVAMTLTYQVYSSSLTVSLTGNADFSVGATTCNAASCSATVTFTPTYPGLRYGAVTATDQDGNVSAITYLYGVGLAPQFGFDLGGLGVTSGALAAPTSVGLGPDGKIYITDTATNGVYQYDDNIQNQTELGITGLGKPAGVAVDGNNTVYVADQTNNQIVTFTASGVQGTLTTTQLSGPSGVGVDGTGKVFIADTGNGRVISIDNQGNETVLASELNAPTGIALDSAGNLYYTDSGSAGEVTEITADGAESISVGTSLGNVHDLAIDAAGRVYVSTDGGDTLIVPDGSQAGYGGGANYGMAVQQNGAIITTQPASGSYARTDRFGSNFVVSAQAGQTTSGSLTESNTGNATLTLSTQTVTGTVFTIDSTNNGCAPGTMLAPGATCNTSVIFAPTANQNYQETLTPYSNNLNVAGSTASFTLYGNGLGKPTTTSLALSSATIAAGQAETFTATVNNDAGITETGTVAFQDNGTTIGMGTITSGAGTGTAQYTTSSLAQGSHSITAVYSGDTNLATSTSEPQAVTVTAGLAATTTTVTLLPSTAPSGGGVTLQASIQGGSTPPLSGQVTFSDEQGQLGVAAVDAIGSGGMASITLSTIPAGMHPITAVYSGDANYAASSSAPVTLTVTPVTTMTMLAVSSASIAFGASETLTATIEGLGSAAFAGTVTFSDQNGVLGTGTVTPSSAGGTAMLTLSTLSAGNHQITAHYNGDTDYIASTSSQQIVTVAPATTSTGLSVSSATIPSGGSETLTATISGGGTPVLSGTVTFSDQTGVLGMGTVTANGTGGTAALTLTTLSVGSHRITARYGGDANYAGSTSAAQTVTVALMTQTITFPAIPNHKVGDAAFGLSATASSGLAVAYSVVSGPATLAGNLVTVTGVGTVVIQADQAGNATYAAAAPVTQSFTVSAVATLAGVSPASAVAGSAAVTVTLSGSGFSVGDVVQWNGGSVASSYVSATTLTAVIPAALLAAAGAGQITVYDPASGVTTASVAFAVVAVPTVVFSGPSMATSGQQPTLTVQLPAAFATALTGTLTLTFTPANSGVDDPAVQFATGGRTETFTVAAGSTTVPTVQLQTGTVAGTATVTLTLVSGTTNVTPATVSPVVITIPAAIPAVTSAAAGPSTNTLTVTVQGYSNTRELKTAIFHFTAAQGQTINNPDITLDVSSVFATWFGSAGSTQYGSSFLYTQTFTIDQDASVVAGVSVTLVNSVGDSVAANTQ
jgi:sugar lactone lactonase YvrE